ncbi:MAG: 2-C-methyl-D-erythritol 4-phosphate cytidylyltransferase [Chitinispirillales bacterium]|jgi:2-C-methyl-D-erythritol 4-phosphate cytidylyltransferase|nr:2-C-methyl-D-erythritol 4-phosphate cytidylyltransferase [Chitinispirillales bacterium]
MSVADAVIVGAGSGARLGHSTPKAFVELCGEPILYYSLKAFIGHAAVNKTILVVSPDMVDNAKFVVDGHDEFIDRVVIAEGGSERWMSVRNGCLAATGEWVLVHDAARPFVTHSVIDSVLEKRYDFDCVITATPEVDTVRTMADGERCGATVDRAKLLRVGTPQLFRRERLMSAFEQVKNMPSPPTDEAALFEALGVSIGFSWGDPINFKITTQTDLEIAQALLEKGQGRAD